MKVLDLRSLGSLRSTEKFRYAESGERLQEERQPGAPCCVSSDDVWRVAVNGYETTRS